MVTHNSGAYIKSQLDRLIGLQLPPIASVVVVDNASTDDTVKILESFKGTTALDVITSPENTGGSGGFARGVRYVLQNIHCDYIWLLDDDAVVDTLTLPALLEASANLMPEYAVLGSVMLKQDEPHVVNEAGGTVRWTSYRLDLNLENTCGSSLPKGLREVDYCAAASLFAHRSIFERVGVFKDFFLHFDDVDWCLRAKSVGYKTYIVFASRVWHPSAYAKQKTWILYYDIRNFLYVYSEHSKKLLGFALAHYLIYAIYLYAHGFARSSKLILSAIRDFYSGAMGQRHKEAEPLSPLTDVAAIVQRFRRQIGIFRTLGNFRQARAALGTDIFRRATVYLLEHTETDITYTNSQDNIAFVRPKNSGKFSSLMVSIRAVLSSLRPSTIAIIDGEAKTKFIVPVFPKRVHIFPQHGNAYVRNAAGRRP